MPDAGPKASAVPGFGPGPVPAGSNALAASRPRKRDAAQDRDQPNALSQLVQGGVLLGVLILLFVLAGFRG